MNNLDDNSEHPTVKGIIDSDESISNDILDIITKTIVSCNNVFPWNFDDRYRFLLSQAQFHDLTYTEFCNKLETYIVNISEWNLFTWEELLNVILKLLKDLKEK